jgi:hypothetical protein
MTGARQLLVVELEVKGTQYMTARLVIAVN